MGPPGKKVAVAAERPHEEEEQQIVADAAEQQEEKKHIDPPYTEETDVANGLPCYFPGCSYKTDDYGLMFQHARAKHGVKQADIKGTYFHKQACLIFNAKQNERNKKKRLALGDTEGDKQKAKKERPSAEAIPSSNASIGEEIDVSDTFQWTVMHCYVKCDLEGNPIQPLEYGGLVSSAQLDRNVKIDGETIAEQQRFGSMEIEKQSKSIASGSQSDASSTVHMHPMKMLADIHSFIQDKGDTTKWLKSVPNAVVKNSYVELEPPKAKREGTGRAYWPKVLQKDFIELPAFKTYLQYHLAKKKKRNPCLRNCLWVQEGHLVLWTSPAKKGKSKSIAMMQTYWLACTLQGNTRSFWICQSCTQNIVGHLW